MTSRDFGIVTLRNAVAYHFDGSIVPINNVYITSTNGGAVFSDTLTISTINVSTINGGGVGGGGVSSISSGINISITGTVSTPIVNVDINSTLLMNGYPIYDYSTITIASGSTINLSTLSTSIVLDGSSNTINMTTSTITSFANNFILNSDLDIKGSSASIQFFDSSNIQKAAIDYAEINDKLTITAVNAVFESTGPGSGRILFDSIAGYTELRGNNISVRMRQYDSLGSVVNTAVDLEGNNINLYTASTSIVLDQASQGITLTTGGASTIQIGPTNISSTYLLLTINSTPYKIALLT